MLFLKEAHSECPQDKNHEVKGLAKNCSANIADGGGFSY